MDGHQINSPARKFVGQTPTSATANLRQRPPPIAYTPREIQAMSLRATGLRTAEIAERMGVAQSTAEYYLRRGLKRGDAKRMAEFNVGPAALTSRERAVLRAIYGGVARKQLAAEIDCTLQNIGQCVRIIRRKLGCVNDVQLGVVAARAGVL